MSKIWFDGKLLEWEESRIHVLTHGLHYGTSAWEGIRIYDGKPFMLEAHCLRLMSSARKINLSHKYSWEDIAKGCEEVTQINQLERGYIRPIIWLGSEQTQIAGIGCTVHASVIAWNAFADRSTFTNQDMALAGLNMEIARWRKPGANCVPPDLKAGGVYMMLSLIKNEAIDKGFDDAIMLDQNDLLAEATTSNIFLIKNDVLYTPAVNGSFLNGITRQIIIEIAKANQFDIREIDLSLNDLHGADAGFITGTSVEITPIAKVYDASLNKHKLLDISHKLILALRKHYHKLTQGEITMTINIKIGE